MNLLTRQCVVEFIGTFSLTFIGAGAIIATGGENLVAIAFAHGLALSMAVYASGHISGGHINPAVTIGMLVTGKIKPPAAAAYIVVQLLGATLAACILSSCLPEAAVKAVKLPEQSLDIGGDSFLLKMLFRYSSPIEFGPKRILTIQSELMDR